MGEVVYLSEFLKARQESSNPQALTGLVPLEFAVGRIDRAECFAILTRHNIDTVHIRMVDQKPDSLVYLLEIEDGIRLNKLILEHEEISAEEIEERIDLIQAMENMNFGAMESLTKCYNSRGEI